jgi:aspartate beta-hydroxylase
VGGVIDYGLSDLEPRAAAAMRGGDVLLARICLTDALALAPRRTDLWLNLAACHRRLADFPQAMVAVDKALALDPRAFLALLTKASLLEATGEAKAAAIAYGVALTQAPPSQEGLTPALRAVIDRAREINGRHLSEMEDFLVEEAMPAIKHCDADERRRVDRFVQDLLGKQKRYRQEPAGFFYPQLAAVEFYDRAGFPWLTALEAATDVIAREAEAVMGHGEGLSPYVDYDESLPLDQWRDLNRSLRWSAFHLFQNGRAVEENCARCPETVATLQSMPQPQLPGRSPSAMFSILAPKTTIPPHTGISNTRLVVHLPLIVPEGCRFRVGGETRTWKRGQAWVFDDTIEHEAVNDSVEPRLILIFDIWQPAISETERQAIIALTSAMDRFGGAPAPCSL